MKSHTSKIIMYIYTFAPQEGVSGGDENASLYYVPAAQQTLALGVRVEPHTSLMKSHTLKIIMYVYTFAPQEGVSGGDENASLYYIPAAQQTLALGVRGAEGAIPG
jgi:hypothetical protein